MFEDAFDGCIVILLDGRRFRDVCCVMRFPLGPSHLHRLSRGGLQNSPPDRRLRFCARRQSQKPFQNSYSILYTLERL